MLSLVVGVGNALRGDDAAGLEVARRVRERSGVEVLGIDGDATALVDAFSGHAEVAIVDAARSDAPPGTLHAFRADRDPLPVGALRSASTHALGVAEAIELARALDRLPARLHVYAIEGAEFAFGEALSAPVQIAVEALSSRLAADH
jgi:hydrogenase maturation protease